MVACKYTNLIMLQALSFFLPYMIYKFSHDGRIQNLLQNLNNVPPFNEHRADKVGDINIYMQGENSIEKNFGPDTL